MNSILTVGIYTFKDLLKSRVMFNIIWVAFFLQVSTYVTSEFSYGNPKKIALDFGLGISSIAAAAIAIFLGVQLISKEIESRTIYIALSRPIKRYQFFLGKLLGMISILFINVFFITTLCVLMYFKFGGVWNFDIFWAMTFTFFECVVVLLVVVLLSLITNTVISVMNTMILFILGYAIPASLKLNFITSRPNLEFIIKVYSTILPNFEKINMKSLVIANHPIPSETILGGLAYILTYIIALTLISLAVFNKKELE